MEWPDILKLTFIGVCLVLGIFGNIQLVTFFVGQRKLRNKTSFLLFLNASIHIICLITRPINIAIATLMDIVPKKTCLTFSTIYLSCMSLQAWSTFFMSVDLFLKLCAPFGFRLVTTRKFALICFGYLAIILSFNLYVHYVGLAHEITGKLSCSSLMVLTKEMQILWVSVQECAVVSTLILYLASMVLLKMRVDLSKQVNQQSLRSIIVILGCFTFLCMFGVTGELWLELANISDEDRFNWINLVMLHMFICFSQNFYICLWRSSSCRSAFKANMYRLVCKKVPESGRLSPSVGNSDGKHDRYHANRKITEESGLNHSKPSF